MFRVNKIKISLGCDHAGFNLKENLKSTKLAEIFSIIDRGCFSLEAADYPDLSKQVVKDLLDRSSDFGVLICNSGIGMSMAANRFNKIRAALCNSVEDVEFSRKHNDANILVIAAKNTQINKLELYLQKFIETKFEGGRHLSRIEKLDI